MKDISIKRKAILFFQGAVIGTGAILPGISGGVLSVAFGIYEMIMELFTNPIKAFKKNYHQLIPICVGVVVGFLLLARAVEWMFAKSATVALMLFFGLICGTLPELIVQSNKEEGKPNWTVFVLTMAIAFVVFEVLGANTSGTMEANFMGFIVCGIACGLSMIVPGLSSSSILLFFGLYEEMAAAVADIRISALIPMGIGMVLTVLTLARIMNMLYKNYYSVVSKVILGFVVASALQIVPSQFSGWGAFGIELLCFAVGFAVARLMDIARIKQESAEDDM